MNRTSSLSHPGSEFHAFLFAAIGEDRNGLPLSVISALARLNLDPWDAAATLARLPADAAARKVIELFRSVPDQTLGGVDRGTLAAGLVALLPRTADSKIKTPPAPFTVASVSNYLLGALVFVIFIFLLMATQLP